MCPLEGTFLGLNPELAKAYYDRCFARKTKSDRESALADYNKAIELRPDLATNEFHRHFLAELKSKSGHAPKTSVTGKTIPTTDKALVLRTDFSNEAAWKSLRAIIENPDAEFPVNVDFVSDLKYDGLKPGQLPAHFSKEYPLSFAFIVDHTALTEPDLPILVIDLQAKPRRLFRVIASALGIIKNNLSTANMGFKEFANAVDENGIFRGF